MESRFSSRTCCSSTWPLASRIGHTLIRTPQLIGRHADRQTDRGWEMTPCPLKQVRWRLKIHARDAEWNPGDYAMHFWFSRIQTAPQATSSWRRRGYRFSRWSQGQAGIESVNLLQHPVRANRTSKMWLMWLRIIPSFQRCTVLWEKSPLSVRKLCKNSCNGNYETPCISELTFNHRGKVITSEAEGRASCRWIWEFSQLERPDRPTRPDPTGTLFSVLYLLNQATD